MRTVGGVRYESWVERQVREATERGEFDNLPGQGQPLRGLTGRDDEDWWIKSFVERERITLLPTTLALRKELAELPETLRAVRDEDEVRRRIEDLNDRVRYTHRHRVDGPPLVLTPVDVEAAVADWWTNRAR